MSIVDDLNEIDRILAAEESLHPDCTSQFDEIRKLRREMALEDVKQGSTVIYRGLVYTQPAICYCRHEDGTVDLWVFGEADAYRVNFVVLGEAVGQALPLHY